MQDILPPLPGLEREEEAGGLIVPRPPSEIPLQREHVGPTFVLRAVELRGNSVFAEGELQAISEPYIGRQVDTADLEDLRRSLTRHYIDAGYVNSGALLPDQTIENGRVVFQIIEGVLGDVEISGDRRLYDGYFEDRIRLSAGPPLNVNDLQRRLRIMLDDPLIHRLDAELTPGLRPGEGRLRLTVEEEPKASLVARLDNALQPSVGGEQIGMDLLLRDLTGFGETVSLSPSLAEGFIELGGHFQVPVSAHDTRLFGRMLYSRSRIVEEPFDALDIESKTYEFGIGVSQPLYRAPGKTLTASLAHDYRVNKTFLLDNPFSFSEGAEDGRTAVSALRGMLEWVDRSQNQVIALRSVVSLGTGLLDSTTHPGARADSEFLSVLGQAQWVRRLGESDARVAARAQAQWTGDRLLPMEKFSVGGVNSVRGYREDLQTGDRGWNASLEFQIPIADLPPIVENAGSGRITVVPFVDAGRAWNVNDSSNEALLSVGAGLVWDITSDVQANLFVGRGLMNRPDPADKDIQDIGIHFSLSAKLY
ncbi:MAG: ShlB/FhaC/HecB family hemolysin secretion/activation protein [Paracoccaceae bacterium]